MTRIEKYQKLRERIAKEIQDNAVIWEQQNKLEQYQQALLKVNSEHFTPIIKNINDSLNLINLENNILKNNHQYLEIKDKYLLVKILSDINQIFETYKNLKIKDNNSQIVIVDYPVEYATLIDGMHNKISEFEKNLESKIKDINAFVKSIEKKYQKDNSTQNFNSSLEQIKQDNNKLQEEYHQLKVKGKTSYKISFIFFAGIVVSLIVIVVLLILLVMLK